MGQNDPRLLGCRKNMDIGWQTVWLVQRTHSHKANVRASATVMAPERNTTCRTTGDVLPSAALAGGMDHLDLAGHGNEPAAFDHGIERKGGARFALAPTAVAAMDDHRVSRHLVADCSAIATTLK